MQCTKWFKKDEDVRLGKVKFYTCNNGNYYVPFAKHVMTAMDWCTLHAKRVGGVVKRKGNLIAVFREE